MIPGLYRAMYDTQGFRLTRLFQLKWKTGGYTIYEETRLQHIKSREAL